MRRLSLLPAKAAEIPVSEQIMEVQTSLVRTWVTSLASLTSHSRYQGCCGLARRLELFTCCFRVFLHCFGRPRRHHPVHACVGNGLPQMLVVVHNQEVHDIAIIRVRT